jgi:K+-transporting ATPase ATPase B chain
MATLAAKQTALSWFVGPDAMKTALVDSFRRLTPRYQWRNPVMFVVYVGALITTMLWLQALFGQGEAPAGFILAVTLWLWVTLLFATSPRRLPKVAARRRRPRSRARAGHRRQEAGAARTRRAVDADAVQRAAQGRHRLCRARRSRPR